jgi:oligopeptide/dipeptide ABC transporter ATP-binding protein
MRSIFKPLYSSASGIAASVLLILFIVLAIIGPTVWGEAASTIDVAKAWQAPGQGAAIFGTDELGRDIFARAMVATQLSLVSAFLASLIAIVVGLPIGLLASAFGSRSTKVFQSVIGVVIAFPALLTAMFVGTIIGIGIPGAVIGIGIAMAPMFARLAQTLTASVAGLDYVAAARTMGVPPFKVLGRHILPNVAEPLIITATTSVGFSLLGISALSFLGLGARPPEYDWGGLLSTGLKNIYVTPMAAILPGALIALAGITFSLLGEALAGSFGDNQHTSRIGRLGRKMAAAAKRAKSVPAEGTVLPAASVLDVRELTVTYPAESGPVSPVRGVSFQLAAGERAGIVGESGSGKSLTVMAVAQLINYPGVIAADRRAFLGQELGTMPDAALRKFLGTHLAMVFQNPMSSLNPAIRIGAQVAETSRVHRKLSAAAGRELAIDKLTEVGIPDAGSRLRQYPHEFSGGMRQRAMIAMGLTEAPDLIIADEPTTALDVTVQRQILDLLEQINQEEGTAILLISHDIAVITSACDRVIVMYAGLVVEDLLTADLLTSAAHPYTRALINAVPDMTTDRTRPLATIPGRPPATGEAAVGCPFAARCAFATDVCREKRPSLDPLAPAHSVACWHPQNGVALAAEIDQETNTKAAS